MPLLPLRDVVVFPHMVLPLFVGREKSILALEDASANDKKILLVTQKDASQDDPTAQDVYNIGTVSSILQLLKLPDGTVKVLVEGVGRALISEFCEEEPFFFVETREIKDVPLEEKDTEVLTRSLISQFEQYVKLNKKIPPEVMPTLIGIDETIRLVDTIAAHMALKISEKQEILEISDLKHRIEYLMNIMESEIELLQVEKRIRSHVKKQMEK
ncbi:MAG: endopeptidase La, partial [Francisellaceae bacterium]|nr:endopeptidase La [Francisellaceae bacterium]